MRRGSPTRRAMEVAAIASVGATTAPSTKPRRQSKPAKTLGATSATAITVNPTKPKARRKMLTRLYRKVAPRSGPGSGVEQRLENNQEDKIGIEGDVRDAGNKAAKQTANDHYDRVWRSQSSSYKSENDDKK